jgi:ABC-type polysaccharide/polyol phosphate transport system ATPase subunit
MKKSNDIAIQLVGISKKYEIHHEKPTLVEKFIKGPNETFWALRDINLTIHKGEKVGIIGPNGSGKTTLLKIIASIATPTEGTIQTHGKIVSLIGLDAGFHDDLSGFQNIYLNGMLLGMSKQEITKALPSIIDFADIKQFIDTPLFIYSQGMKLRLGFSIAVHANPDILISDEGLSVGDNYFKQKAYSKMETFFKEGKTIITVSHDMVLSRIYDNRIILLKEGKIIRDGGVSVISYYQKNSLKAK